MQTLMTNSYLKIITIKDKNQTVYPEYCFTIWEGC